MENNLKPKNAFTPYFIGYFLYRGDGGGFGGDCHNRPISEAHSLDFRCLQAALGFASLAWRNTIRHLRRRVYSSLRFLRWRVCPSTPGKKSALPKKNCAYSLQDKIVFVDLWVNCFFGSFPHPLDGGGGWVPICGFSSDLDQNRAVLWSKSEMKHLKHPKHLKHLKHCLWMPGLLFCQHFKELGGKVKDGVHGRQDQ